MPRRGWWREGWRLVGAEARQAVRTSRAAVLIVVSAGGAVGVLLGALAGEPSLAIVLALLGAAVGAAGWCVVHGLRHRGIQPVDGYISDRDAADARAAVRRGDLTGVPDHVRLLQVRSAEQMRRSFPLLVLGEAILSGGGLVIGVGLLIVGYVTPSTLVSFAVLVFNGAMALWQLQVLGSTTAILDAEARAVARAAEELGG